jgi:F-type H+-transporting ATPase subunit delta
MILAKKRALALLPRIQQEFETAADEQEGLQYVEVRTAVPIDDATQEGIAQGLRGFLGKDVRLAARVDPAVLGGMVLRIGDRVIDGSARGRLQALRHSLVLTG